MGDERYSGLALKFSRRLWSNPAPGSYCHAYGDGATFGYTYATTNSDAYTGSDHDPHPYARSLERCGSRL